ncbi:MAG: DUF2167 domain-containing protein [Longimicrobiales bacterium]|nr:DUF2167 domain-containing protein [Longimicrobiales bacterium]
MRAFGCAALLTMALSVPLAAQDQDSLAVSQFEQSLHYETGSIEIGDDLATLAIPDEFRFLGPEDSRRLLVDGWGNPPREAPLGMILPSALSPMSEEGWAVVLTYEEDGYVDDEEAGSIDYTELLREMQKDIREESEVRTEAGYEPIELVGWAAPPHYDASTHKLYWAQELKFGDTDVNTLNYNIRILGRRGVLVLNAVAGMSELAPVESGMQDVMAFVNFNDGHRYTDFVPGTDKVAAYGIGALVAGKVAAKVGLFKLLLAGLLAAKKLVVVAVVAIAAFLRRLMGGKAVEETP